MKAGRLDHILITTDLQYKTRSHQVDSGYFWDSLKGFKWKGLAEDDLPVATLTHCKNGKS